MSDDAGSSTSSGNAPWQTRRVRLRGEDHVVIDVSWLDGFAVPADVHVGISWGRVLPSVRVMRGTDTVLVTTAPVLEMTTMEDGLEDLRVVGRQVLSGLIGFYILIGRAAASEATETLAEAVAIGPTRHLVKGVLMQNHARIAAACLAGGVTGLWFEGATHSERDAAYRLPILSYALERTGKIVMGAWPVHAFIEGITGIQFDWLYHDRASAYEVLIWKREAETE